MKNFKQWTEEAKPDPGYLERDPQGGIVPQRMDAAKKADLITLPREVAGTNCFNCRFMKEVSKEVGFCEHKEVHQYVNRRNCCAFWDNPGVHRPWK